MILITGGTGFIGNVLVRHLSNLGYQTKLLIRPSKQSPHLPYGIRTEVAITSLNDAKGLRAAMKGVDVVYHLASAEFLGRQAKLTHVDVAGTQAIVEAATQAKIERIIFLSHLGADRSSAFPLLKAKGIAENAIKSSGIPYTIFRSALTYGEGDHFTNPLAFLLKLSPYFAMLPDGGSTILQPIWVEDLASVITWCLDLSHTINETIELGGVEYLSFKEICTIIAKTIKIKREYISISPILLNRITEILEIIAPNFPTSVFWLDYLASNRTTSLDVLPRVFSLVPARMNQRLSYLKRIDFNKFLWKLIYKRKRTATQWE